MRTWDYKHIYVVLAGTSSTTAIVVLAGHLTDDSVLTFSTFLVIERGPKNMFGQRGAGGSFQG